MKGREATRRRRTAAVIGFILGVVFWTSIAGATRSVEVTFYRSPTPSVWCYLSDSVAWVECIDDPCKGYRYEAEQARNSLSETKAEAEQARRDAEDAKLEVSQARRDAEQARLELRLARREVERARQELNVLRGR